MSDYSRAILTTRLGADTARWIRDVIEGLLHDTRADAELGLTDMAPGIAWTQEHLDERLRTITPPDAAS